jgi:hypothetical protein
LLASPKSATDSSNLSERKTALEAWARHVESLIRPTPSNVVDCRGALKYNISSGNGPSIQEKPAGRPANRRIPLLQKQYPQKTAPINRTTPQHRVRTFKTGRPISSMIDDKESVIALKPMLSEY